MEFDKIKSEILERGISFLYLRKCSMCDYDLGYIVRKFADKEPGVLLDTGCYCVGYRKTTTSSWEDIETFYNLHDEKIKKEIMRQWGIL